MRFLVVYEPSVRISLHGVPSDPKSCGVVEYLLTSETHNHVPSHSE